MTLTTGSSGGLGGGAPNFPISAGLEAAGLSAAANMQILLQTNNDLMIAIHKTLLETTHETSRKIESLRDDVRDIKLNLQKNDNTLKEEATNWRAHTELLLKEQGERHNQDISRLMDMLMKLVISDSQTTKQFNSVVPGTIPASILKAATVTAPTVAATTPTPTVATIASTPTVTTSASIVAITTSAPIVATTTPTVTAPVVTAAVKSEPAPTSTIVTAPKPVVTSSAQNFKTVTAPTVTTTAFASPFQQAPAPTATAFASPFQQAPAPIVTTTASASPFQQIATQTTTVGVGNFGFAAGRTLFGGGAKGGNTSFADLAKKTSEGGGGLFDGGLKPQFGTSPFNPTAAQAPNFKFFSAQQPSLNGSVHSKATDENRDEDESDKEGETPEDDYTPDVHYHPAIELPPEVEVVSGEENEEVLFQARCKLYRYDREAKENKERGLGDIKILKNLATQKYRCIMRREKVLKLCANFPIVGELKLHKREQMPTVYTWACKDFSENLQSGEDETFSVRFKDVTIANEFNEKMMEAVEQMKIQE